MKTLRRNHITIFYSNPTGNTVKATDAYGNYTGEETIEYGPTVRYKRFSFGAQKGVVALEPFGLADGYVLPLVTDDMDCPITDASRLWINACPCDGNGNARPHTHVVEAIIPTINVVKVLCKAVSVS